MPGWRRRTDATYSVQAAQLRSRGVELEARTRVGRREMIANYAYTDARTTKSNVAAEIGQRVSGKPDHSVDPGAGRLRRHRHCRLQGRRRRRYQAAAPVQD